ncbi:hypothetical protein Clacol_009445 [Clathrus columnatus]|uniref:Mitochondrial DNA polymerase catalytic subunit n=1 Tax=Clathrus columnatus TaxID=1419009 RepID=A0AAV5AQU2_9AGAM|nr:hypothetical protein Clacol_009445 [Clathrus columnatus]
MNTRISQCSRGAVSLRSFTSTSRLASLSLKQKSSSKQLPPHPQPDAEIKNSRAEQNEQQTTTSNLEIQRNPLGVQLLSPKLHSQLFKNSKFPAPVDLYVQIARNHLIKHKLDPNQSSSHPPVSFTLPPLEGHDLDSHFYAIGSKVAEPYLSLSKMLASVTSLPPPPEDWVIQSGWTKYWTGNNDGLHESIDYPNEEMLVFDVETLPNYSPYAIMACAASPTAWYAWISPWLLGETTQPEQLIPLGDPQKQRIVVGHNVAYDRARTLEEYHIHRTGTRWMDTMALHVAVNGISSHQRSAWSQYRKQKIAGKTMKEEAVESVLSLIDETKERIEQEANEQEKQNLERRLTELEESLPSLQAVGDVGGMSSDSWDGEQSAGQRWEELTAVNSLAEVARLHCGIEVDKTIRDDFMTSTREAILSDITSYLTYCAKDVSVTHQVFCKILPAFLEKCPNPVSFAGMCSMGSSFLPVDENWEKYLEAAEETYKTLENKVTIALKSMTESVRRLFVGEKWKGDVWLEQLDWTPKSVRAGKGEEDYEAEFRGLKAALPSPKVFQHGVKKEQQLIPKFLNDLTVLGPSHPYVLHNVLPYVMRLQLHGEPVRYTRQHGWHSLLKDEKLPLSSRMLTPQKSRLKNLFDRKQAFRHYKTGVISRPSGESMNIWLSLVSDEKPVEVVEPLKALATKIFRMYCSDRKTATKKEEWEPWIELLEWTPVIAGSTEVLGEAGGRADFVPTWYWQLGKASMRTSPENIEITVRSRVAPLLFRLKWQGWPLVFSREHGWTFRVAKEALDNGTYKTRQKELSFKHADDQSLREISEGEEGSFSFFKLPHKDGEEANVGSPLGKTFIKFAADGTLSSPEHIAGEALEINAQCSYWISARDRIMKQLVVWDKDNQQGLQSLASPDKKWGIILPQVITMGTVTRRAIEKTWLTASNAKENRVGSELKAMVRAPEGYAIVGADVDSEELWISSCMGDAQFGLHGATAIGWMTLEGTKKAGTDLHSKTASILGITRDQAKVFNYSRIYGAGMKHAMLLLLQSNASMLPEQAQKLAEQLYASTKGKNTHRPDLFGHKFWYGGTESFVFNKLEQIAISDEPKTPVLDCGVTYALSKQYLPEKFGADYLPSRINWVVQSSGVDYLHLLIVSMEHLIQKYDIQARYLISVHDELRYLVKEEDKYRSVLALQIANLWTRSIFAYRLGMDNLPQGVAFFSAVDVDKVLRKEVDMPCVTPSQPIPIPPGESLDIIAALEKTSGGSLWRDGALMEETTSSATDMDIPGYTAPDFLVHRASNVKWLKAQATNSISEIKFLADFKTSPTIAKPKVSKSAKPRKTKNTNTETEAGSSVKNTKSNKTSKANIKTTTAASVSTPIVQKRSYKDIALVSVETWNDE